jgi:cbb3-type cytochrome c oxidase subunit III
MFKAILVTAITSSLLLANSGKELFNTKCTACHGQNGQGKEVGFHVNPRNLTKSILTESQIVKVIKHGAVARGALTDEMRSFSSELSDDEINKIAKYVFNTFVKDSHDKKIDALFKSEYTPIDKKEKMLKVGKKIFKRNCSFCHGVKGLGDGLATTNPEKSIFPYNLSKTILDEDQIFLFTKFGGKHWGTARGDMPSWSKKYNDYKLKSVAKYIEQEIKKN